MKKIFVEIYLMFNLGDDLFLDILAKKYPDCQFTVNYLGVNYDTFLSHYKNVNRRKYTLINKIGQKLRITDSITNYSKIAEEHDALLFIGGSIFREEEYHRELYKDRNRLVKEFKKREKPTFILGANFGPYYSKEFYEDYLAFFKLCDDVCFRDKYSYELYKSLEQVRYAPDIVFQLSAKPYMEISKKNRVGFSIIDVNHKKGLSHYEEEYISSTVKSICLFVEKGYECYLMSFCENEGDLVTINKIKSKLDKKTISKVKTYNYTGDFEEAIQLISSLKIILAARFHANILALILGVGLISIIYSSKTTNMLKDLGITEVVTMDMLSLQFDDSFLEKALNNKIQIKELPNYSEGQFHKLESFIKGKTLEGV
ncbi:polysaccharide pyruvyl transferase family protein [Robertmurraya beringensis]|uniref:Polysaccharide pyruvyl transferase family protein n=1 Tax=Robertmurraya beringensis TaxID=641660 RepID=A0ABV6KS17_9BACI